MATYLDIIGAFMVAGALLLIAFTASDTATTEFFNYNSDAITQHNISQLSRVMHYDLRKMGYGIPEAEQPGILLTGQNSRIKFLTHLNNDPDCRLPVAGSSVVDDIPDTIEYVIQPREVISFGDTSITTYQVTRRVFITPSYQSEIMVGMIGNSDVFRYLDQMGMPVSTLAATKMIEVTLTAFNPRVVLSPEYVFRQVNGISDPVFRKKELRRLLRSSFWRQTRLISKNLRR